MEEDSTSQLKPATFQDFKSHTWLGAAVLGAQFQEKYQRYQSWHVIDLHQLSRVRHLNYRLWISSFQNKQIRVHGLKCLTLRLWYYSLHEKLLLSGFPGVALKNHYPRLSKWHSCCDPGLSCKEQQACKSEPATQWACRKKSFTGGSYLKSWSLKIIFMF